MVQTRISLSKYGNYIADPRTGQKQHTNRITNMLEIRKANTIVLAFQI